MTGVPFRHVFSQIRIFALQHRVPLLAALVLLVLGLFISQRQEEVASIARALRQAHPFWVLLALTANLAVVSGAGLTYRTVLSRLGHRHSWFSLVYLHLRRHVVGVATPIGGPASIYVFVRSLGGRGVPAHDALFTVAIRSLCGYSAFVMILLPVLFFNRPSGYILVGAIGITLFLGALITTMGMLLRPSFNPPWLMTRLPSRLTGAVQQARRHHLRPSDFLAPFALLVIHNALGILTLYLCLLAVGYQGALTTAIAGFAIGNLFMMIAPVFQGIGVVEFTMSMALHQFGVPLPMAIAATLLFRFSDVWFPFLIGIGAHAFLHDRSREVLSRSPAVAAGTVGLLVLLTPLMPTSLPIATVIPSAIAVAGGVWCMLMAHALWRRRPVGLISAYGAIAIFTPLLVYQAGGILGLSLPFLPLVIS
jgi:uncharacterized protein (TIRG00374 family)